MLKDDGKPEGPISEERQPVSKSSEQRLVRSLVVLFFSFVCHPFFPSVLSKGSLASCTCHDVCFFGLLFQV